MNTETTDLAAMTRAAAYAWGREDASGTRTVSPTAAPGSLTFSEAWSARMYAFKHEATYYMPNLRVAYDEWQAAGGRPAWANAANKTILAMPASTTFT